MAAIEEAEKKSSGEIRLFVSKGAAGEPLAAARKQFQKLGMEKTRERNGVLLYFAPEARQFAIVGDSGVHEKCGDDFWQQISRDMSEDFKAGRFTVAIVGAIRKVGDVLARHFPRRPDDQNELPNQIARD